MADMLSQEEINALLGGVMEEDEPEAEGANELDQLLSAEEKDVLGEVGNISMGTAATTLFALLGQRVEITTPEVSMVKLSELVSLYDRPCAGIRVNYVTGIKGSNVLILRHLDAKIITSLMMGHGGEVDDAEELTEIDLSAISEAMNQMVGSSATSLSSLISSRVEIDTPLAFVLDFNKTNEHLDDLGFDDDIAVCVRFKMEIGDLIDSNIMQLLPLPFARHLVDVMKSYVSGNKPAGPAQAAPALQPEGGRNMATSNTAQPPRPPAAGHYAPPPQPQPAHHGHYAPPPQAPVPQYMPPPVTATAVQFQAFDAGDVAQQKENIEIIMDVPLEVTVELGRTSRKIKDILEFAPGSIIELDKLAGEPIDILVNGKFVAKGEVVVIDENFSIRVTSIINAEYRI